MADDTTPGWIRPDPRDSRVRDEGYHSTFDVAYKQMKDQGMFDDKPKAASKTPPAKSDTNKAAPAKDVPTPSKVLGSRKKGGPIKKTGLYKLHKGEKVLTKKQRKKVGR